MLTYLDLGEGTPVVLIHGLGSCKEAWEPQYPLQCKHRLIIPDLRGHGETAEETDITLENFARDILDLLNHLNVPRAFICGLSLGGIVAQEIYRQAPSRVLGLILANTTAYIPTMFATGIMNKTEQHYQDSNFVDYIADRGLCNKDYFEKAKEGFLIRDCYMEAAKAPLGKNYFPTLLGVEVPVLLLGGSDDKVTPLAGMWLMYMFIRDVRIKVLQDCGHLSNIEKARQFNHHLNQFIEEETK